MGSATITVTTEDGGFIASCVVTVIPDEAPSSDADVILQFKAGDPGAETKTTVEFFAGNKTVEVTSRVAGSYDLSYETSYEIAENKLNIVTATGVKATMLESFVPVLGSIQPNELTDG